MKWSKIEMSHTYNKNEPVRLKNIRLGTQGPLDDAGLYILPVSASPEIFSDIFHVIFQKRKVKLLYRLLLMQKNLKLLNPVHVRRQLLTLPTTVSGNIDENKRDRGVLNLR